MPDLIDAAERGLYRPDLEHDACGVGFVADIRGRPSHEIVSQGLHVLENLEHRGAAGEDAGTGDGAGILVKLPHAFFSKVALALGFVLPEPGAYGVSMMFLPSDNDLAHRVKQHCAALFAQEGLQLLGWRNVPVNPDACGATARRTQPAIVQAFVASWDSEQNETLECKLYSARKQLERSIAEFLPEVQNVFYVCSLSCRTVIYKGLLMPQQIAEFYPDLQDTHFASPIALVHQRFSTNTFPSWQRAHPYRFIAHNGEINTLKGNVHWMRAREEILASPRFPKGFEKLRPIIDSSGSDSAMFDNALELLLRGGRSLPHALMMMMPQAWQNETAIDPALRDFYAYHSALMEPWDGPAAVAFSDGECVGAALDRNGLRPARYIITTDEQIVLASEVGALPIANDRIRVKGRLRPGQMLLVDTRAGRVLEDAEIKSQIAAAQPYGAWLKEQQKSLADLPNIDLERFARPELPLRQAQQLFGYSEEDLRLILTPMAQNSEEAVGSMGNDTPLACLSDQPQLIYQYFRQLFAQVTNPPIDPIREALVMSLSTTLGAEHNLLEETPEHCSKLQLDQPILSNHQLVQLLECNVPELCSHLLPTLYDVKSESLESAIQRLCAQAKNALRDRCKLLILSDRGATDKLLPIPSLLATAAIHHYLIREGLRTGCSLIVETGDAREVMHFCLLLGYGAGAVNPYLAFASIDALVQQKDIACSLSEARAHYIKATNKGILKVMSKMGISTLASYRGAQIFEAVGLQRALIDKYFTWTPCRLEAVGMDRVARDLQLRHARAFGDEDHTALDVGGQYQWRRDGEYHAYNPDTIASLQHAVRSGNYALFNKYSAHANSKQARRSTLRGLLRFRQDLAAIPLEQVEPVASIVKRFKTGAMSLGSISRESHELLAVAMNRLGARSNTGEGGEDPARYVPDANGDNRRSAIKQVASGRFGVTIDYLVNADELQIKIAQGAKPGEGGQLPGHKISDYIAQLRCSTPGVTLISPPPHHDIYSIEDLGQLIYDLKNANPLARISVKLVAEVGVGTIAAGVCKAGADVIVISGDSGGTGAAGLASIKHVGVPWELGLAEAQQVLVLNSLRDRVILETDGQLKTGRDVAIACLLGAEEFGFATAALVASGCVMMRVCHLNTCPVGIATQDPALRQHFAGQPEHVINFMLFVAEQLREIMASLGLRTIEEMVGRSDLLEQDTSLADPSSIDLGALLYFPPCRGDKHRRNVTQNTRLPINLDNTLMALCRATFEHRAPVKLCLPIRNTDRSTGTQLSSMLTRRFGNEPLPDSTIEIEMTGSAGQSFAAFLAPGITMRLMGDANDYCGKGLSGGRIIVRPPRDASYVAEDNTLIGNVALYGATSGEVFLRGIAGERFAVRNSGALAVVEGTGDHGCEYMTGGTVLVLGATGKNFAAGMSGGAAYVYRVQTSSVNTADVEILQLDDNDWTRVQTLLQRHFDYTQSAVAQRLLADVTHARPQFVKIIAIGGRK